MHMQKTSLVIGIFCFLFCASLHVPTLGQDCDALIQPRPVPNSAEFVHVTREYTMITELGSVTVTALTAEDVVALVFNFARGRETCVQENTNIHIRFTNGDNIAMQNAAGKNCDGRVALYFGRALGNVGLLHFFQENKIRFVRIMLNNGRWLKINFAEGMRYNLKRSMKCLAQRVGAEAPDPGEASTVVDLTDSLDISRVSTMPQFEGGHGALTSFFGRNMRTLSIVDRGVVIVSFLVDANGDVHDPKVVRGVSEKIDAEARRLVLLMPKWKPATKDGVPVDARTKVVIAF